MLSVCFVKIFVSFILAGSKNEIFKFSCFIPNLTDSPGKMFRSHLFSQMKNSFTFSFLTLTMFSLHQQFSPCAHKTI